MKKVGLLLLSFLLILVISGCDKKEEKFYLEDNYYVSEEMEDVPGTKIEELEDNEESFAVFVYMASCTSCAHFDKILESFLEEHPIKIYKVSLLNIKGTKMEGNVKFSPSIVLYNKGEIVSYLNAISDDDMRYYQSKEDLKEWLEQYIYLEKNN